MVRGLAIALVMAASVGLAASQLDAKSRKGSKGKVRPKATATATPGTATPAKVAASSSAPLDLNLAGKPELSPLPVLSSEAKWAILNFRQFQTYASPADFATKVCSRFAVDFGPTDVVINGTVLVGFKCLVPASGTYQANGSTYSYPVAPEVTGTTITPPAPPG